MAAVEPWLATYLQNCPELPCELKLSEEAVLWTV